jgi:hypothetical protein
MKINKTKTARGFALNEFEDLYSQRCSLQKSSLADQDAIWFGCNDAPIKVLVSGQGWQEYVIPHPKENILITNRMHLSRAMVKKLLPTLVKFAYTGEI